MKITLINVWQRIKFELALALHKHEYACKTILKSINMRKCNGDSTVLLLLLQLLLANEEKKYQGGNYNSINRVIILKKNAYSIQVKIFHSTYMQNGSEFCKTDYWRYSAPKLARLNTPPDLILDRVFSSSLTP